jgi:hypothetical protein
MTAIHPDLLAVLDSVEILSPSRYAIRGEIRDVAAEEPSHSDAIPLLSGLEADLYARLYLRPSPPSPARAVDWLARRDFLTALSSANTGHGTWETGWTILQAAENGQVAVARNELTVWATAAELRVPGGIIEPGERCQVRVPKEFRQLVTGFYFALGDDEALQTGKPLAESPDATFRFYWHLTRDFAVPFIASATALLNSAGLPFRLKVPNDPDAYTRADAGVLYVGRRHARELGDTLAMIHDAVAAGLRPETPLFTCRLGDGVALAEEPPTASSFGQHRCKIIARALWRSFVQADSGRDARAATLAAVLRHEGIDPEHPFLGPDSLIDEIKPLIETFRVQVTSSRPIGGDTKPSKRMATVARTPLDAAARIGEALCLTAHWDTEGRLCNWVGRGLREVTQEAFTPTTAALGPDLYSGSAGVGLFLAQLYASTGDADCRRTSISAIARSIRQIDRRSTDLTCPLSFFCGHLGVAYAAQRVGALTGDERLGEQAALLFDRVSAAMNAPHPLDVIGGNAGAIPALLAMNGSAAGSHDCELAIDLGEELCRAAVRQEGVWTWDPNVGTGVDSACVPLTGMSHGAAGIALALLELYAATRRHDFLEAARGAFAYEDSVFNPNEGNWPDLRAVNPPGESPRPPSYGQAWCHGAPGIALARLRASAIDSGHADAHLAIARTAIDTTIRAIDENVVRDGYDASLCHGLAGLLEIVLIAATFLNEPAFHQRVVAAATVLMERHDAQGNWPSGLISGGPNPSLMLGLAGTGYFFLRLHDPVRVPSVFLLVA